MRYILANFFAFLSAIALAIAILLDRTVIDRQSPQTTKPKGQSTYVN
jgi:hypothetical protein